MGDKGTKSLTPHQAWQMLQDDPLALLVDIRSTVEYDFVGHSLVPRHSPDADSGDEHRSATHVGWIDDEYDWMINPDFEADIRAEIRKLLDKQAVNAQEDPAVSVILICRSGKRSLEAGKVLLEGGIENVFHIDEGFEGDLDENRHRGTIGGWRFRGLPWKQC